MESAGGPHRGAAPVTTPMKPLAVSIQPFLRITSQSVELGADQPDLSTCLPMERLRGARAGDAQPQGLDVLLCWLRHLPDSIRTFQREHTHTHTHTRVCVCAPHLASAPSSSSPPLPRARSSTLSIADRNADTPACPATASTSRDAAALSLPSREVAHTPTRRAASPGTTAFLR